MDELINDFIAETREMLEALSGAVVAWEAEPGDRARLDEIFRFVHTVKGNCGFFDLPRLERLSHSAEDALAEVRAGRRTPDSRLVGAVLAILDRIGELVEAMEAGETIGAGDDEPLIDALSERASDASAGAADSSGSAAVAVENRRSLRTIRLSVDLLDRIMNGVSDAVLARNELARRLRDGPADVAVDSAFERVSACIAEIRDAITRTRMQRIDGLFAALPRMVRGLSEDLGKQIRLDIDGGDVELDREMIETIRDPMTHIVRNAIDHGIEPPGERVKAGKAPVGTLSIAARQAGNQILIEVADDGRGIDGAQLVRKAIAAGILTEDQAERLSPAQRTALIFEPGLSTAGEVTAISGRGVGMDVVRANIERIGGVVDVESRPGEGLRLTIRVPLTLTIIPALTVSAGGQIFAIPRSAIEEILRVSGHSVRIGNLAEASVATVRGKKVPLVRLSSLMGVTGEGAAADASIVLLKPAGGDLYALAVDAVHDHEELVVKPAAPAVMAAGFYAGTTIADDGRPILLLDPSGIAGRAGLYFGELDRDRAAPADKPAAGAGRGEMLLFRTLDGAARGVRLAVVKRIEDVPAESVGRSAGMLRVAVNGKILPLAGCQTPPETGKLRVLRLTDGVSELAYAFADVIDIAPVPEDVRSAPSPGEVSGVALVEGRQVELLDPYWLFAMLADGGRRAERPPVCVLPEGDPWMENILRPLLESLGYVVGDRSDGAAADLVVATEGADPPAAAGAKVLRIRSSPEAGNAGDESIYRYDRAALIGALALRAGTERSHG